jgi:hypothetical protein
MRRPMGGLRLWFFPTGHKNAPLNVDVEQYSLCCAGAARQLESLTIERAQQFEDQRRGK